MDFKKDAYLQWIFFSPIILSTVLAFPLMVYGLIGTISFLFLIIGGALILNSKWKLKMRTKVPFEWGSKGMSNLETFIYRIGYLSIIIGSLVAIVESVGAYDF